MSLSQAKTLGQVGSILVFIPLVNIVGLILILLSINDVSKSVQDRSVFTNAMIAVVLQIVGVAIGFFVVFAGFAAAVFTGGLSAVFGLFTGLAAVWICFVIAAYFLRKSYQIIASRLAVPAFGTAGMLFLIGSGLVIVFGIGVVVIFVAYIFQAIAFFSIPDQQGPRPVQAPFGPQTIPPPPAASAPTLATPQRYCPTCGNPVDSSAKFCRNCGRAL